MKSQEQLQEQGRPPRETGLLRQFAGYAGLNILGATGLSCYILADTFFIAQGLAADGLAALNLALPAYGLASGCGKMLGMGGAIQYSVLRGQGEDRRAKAAFSWSIAVCLALSLVFFLAGLFCSGPIARLLGAQGVVLEMSRRYLQVLLLFVPAFMLNGALVCFVRNDGSPQLAMLAMLCGSFANILLDYLLIFPLQMGIFGAALATGIAPVIGLLILSLHWRKKDRGLAPARPQGAPWRRILALGFPTMVAEICASLMMMVFNLKLLELEGDLGVAAYGVVANLAIVAVAIFDGLGQGMQPLVSRAHGGGRKNQVRKLLNWGLLSGLALAAALTGAALLWTDPIAGLFNSRRDPALQQMACQGLRLYFLAMPFAGINMVAAAYFAATERAAPAQAVTLARGFGLALPAMFLLSAWLGIVGVWLAVPVAEGLTALAALLAFGAERRRERGL